MTTCPACGSEVDPKVTKCPSCGTQLAGGTAQMGQVGGVDVPLGAEAVPEEIGPAAQPSLVVVKGPDTGQRFVLEGAEVTIGRSPDSDIFLNDVTVSRDHAILSIEGDVVTVTDRGSLNGTYVNGSIVDEAALLDGDHVQVGRFLLVFFAGQRAGAPSDQGGS